MQSEKKARDIMIGIFEFPHIPYWFSIKQTIKIIRISFISTKKYVDPMAILVFDEKYNLMGTLTLQDILKGIEPKLASASSAPSAEREQETTVWNTLFTRESKEFAEKPASDIMVPSKYFVEPDDPVIKAAYLMFTHDLILLPVLENKKKLIGLVRMIEVFDEITNGILKE